MKKEKSPRNPFITNNVFLFVMTGIVSALCFGTLKIPYSQEEDRDNQWGTFACAAGVLAVFYGTCKYAEAVADTESGTDALFGIQTLMYMATAFLGINYLSVIQEVIPSKLQENRKSRINGAGVLLVLGAGSILFGFLDNYGMKLGTDALEGGLFKDFGSRMMHDKVLFEEDLQVFQQNLAYIEKGSGDAVETFKSSVKAKYTDAFDAIDDAKGMLGNTFSDFVGALLGAGVGKIFESFTGYSGDVNSTQFVFRMLQNPVMKVLLEAFFIGLGCLIPVMIHFAEKTIKLKEDHGKKQHGYFRVFYKFLATSAGRFVVGIVSVLLGIMLATVISDPTPLEDQDEEGVKSTDIGVGAAAFGFTVISLIIVYFVSKSEMESMKKIKEDMEKIEKDVEERIKA